MSRAWFSGFLAVFLAHLAWFGAICAAARVDAFMPLVVVLQFVVLNVAGVAAFIVARRAPRLKLPLALTMAPLAAAVGTVANLLFRFAGIRVDISGFYNNAGLFISLLSYASLVAAIGAACGVWAGRNRGEKRSAPVAATPAVADTLPEISVAPAPAAAQLPQIRSD
jgi:amino acid transporter